MTALTAIEFPVWALPFDPLAAREIVVTVLAPRDERELFSARLTAGTVAVTDPDTIRVYFPEDDLHDLAAWLDEVPCGVKVDYTGRNGRTRSDTTSLAIQLSETQMRSGHWQQDQPPWPFGLKHALVDHTAPALAMVS